MVCLGNICRSPLAEGILQHLADEKGLDWEVDSAGTLDYHVGSPPDKRSIAVAKNNGIDISKQTCRMFTKNDFNTFDRIYVMDRYNLNDILGMARALEDRKKVKLLIDEDIVPDPYYDDEAFPSVFEMIEKRCKEIVAAG